MNSSQIDLGGRSYWPADQSKPVREIALPDLLRGAAAEAGERVALVDGCPDPAARRSWTYTEMLEIAERIARSLLGRFKPGERILMLAPNSAEWVLAQMGAGLAGLVVVTANPAYRDREIQYVLETSGVVGVLLVDEWRGHDLRGCVERLRGDVPAVREVIRLAQWDDLVGAAGDVPLPHVSPDEPAQIQYTGGTTGFPKGVVLHHRGICNTPNFVLTQAGMRDGDTWINAMPLFHVGGCVTTGLGIVGRRGTHVVLPEFDPALVLDLIDTQQGNMSLLVPTMLIRVLDDPSFARRDVSSLHTMVSGAAPVPAELIRRTKREFDCQFTNIFGQTEVSGVVTTTRVDDTPEDQAESIGRGVPQVELKIADPVDGGEVLPIDAEGEICARGYQLMLGYLDNPEATAHTLRPDGWLRTGDLGSMDERGYLKITGRLKDLIIRGGENISPREIEEVLFELDTIAEIVVLGVPDEEWGEEVAAVVRMVAGVPAPDAGELREYCRARVAHFKAPALWSFVSAYPTTPAGKVEKFTLLDQIVAGELVTERPRSDEARRVEAGSER